MRELTLTIAGRPASQGSKRHVGNGRLVEMDKKLPAWREAVKNAVGDRLGPDWVPMDGPLKVEAVFYLPRPKKPKFEEPAVPPDVDKLTRGLLDSLTIAGVIVDDARVTHTDMRKTFATNTTGCVVTIRETIS